DRAACHALETGWLHGCVAVRRSLAGSGDRDAPCWPTCHSPPVLVHEHPWQRGDPFLLPVFLQAGFGWSAAEPLPAADGQLQPLPRSASPDTSIEQACSRLNDVTTWPKWLSGSWSPRACPLAFRLEAGCSAGCRARAGAGRRSME